MDFATMDGTATAGQDYIPQSGTLRFGALVGPWEKFLTFNVPTRDDALVAGSETILLSLSNPSDGVVLGAQSTATIVIADNDTSAGPGRGANDAVQAILPLADGKAIIGGVSTNVVAGYPNSLLLQGDQKLIVGGRGTSIAGMDRDGLVRLNPDGPLDSTFDPILILILISMVSDSHDTHRRSRFTTDHAAGLADARVPAPAGRATDAPDEHSHLRPAIVR